MHDKVPVERVSVHAHSHGLNRFAVIPTAEKLNSDPRFIGRGITIAFLDSGFYPHPDFIGGVVAFHDIHGQDRSLSTIEPQGHHWHGTQTVTSCAGNGALSNGLYRGIACEANLVLVKVSNSGRIDDRSIEAGLEWILRHREMYGIRILNMSLGGDVDLPTSESRINELCEELTAAGVVITVASGNSHERCTVPPASAPSVITVGGYSDENQLQPASYDLYHSSFGKTLDGNVKPEVVAPAMYVAAPILPDTTDYKEAETLSMLAASPDFGLRPMLQEFWKDAGLEPDVLYLEPRDARSVIEYALHRRKIVSAHYQHVDGTSFAAPITASVIAQMLEANPRLSPAAVKNILITTAERIQSQRPIRQGFGVLKARRAVELALSEKHFFDSKGFSAPTRRGNKVVFTFHRDQAQSVNLVGDLNGWDRTSLPMKRSRNGLWRLELDKPGREPFRYKFLVDNTDWIEDPTHGMKEEDGFGGFHSVLEI